MEVQIDTVVGRWLSGGQLYDVDRALQCAMLQQLVAIDEENARFTILGPITKKLLVTVCTDDSHEDERDHQD